MGRKVKPIEHGSERGYWSHQRHEDLFGPPCDACLAAHADYQSEYRQEKGRDRTSENQRKRIKSRALARLADNHKDELDTLMAEIEQELKESAS